MARKEDSHYGGPTLKKKIQYSGDLKSGHVQILNGQKEVGLLILNGIWKPEAQPYAKPIKLSAIMYERFLIRSSVNLRLGTPKK